MKRFFLLIAVPLAGVAFIDCGNSSGSSVPEYTIVSEVSRTYPESTEPQPDSHLHDTYVVSVFTEAQKTKELRAIAAELRDKHSDSSLGLISFAGQGGPVGDAQAFRDEEAARRYFGDEYDTWKKPLEENDYILVTRAHE